MSAEEKKSSSVTPLSKPVLNVLFVHTTLTKSCSSSTQPKGWHFSNGTSYGSSAQRSQPSFSLLIHRVISERPCGNFLNAQPLKQIRSRPLQSTLWLRFSSCWNQWLPPVVISALPTRRALLSVCAVFIHNTIHKYNYISLGKNLILFPWQYVI